MTPSFTRRQGLQALAGLAAAGVGLSATGCSPAQQSANGGGSSGGAATNLTVRVWDEQLQQAYDKSFAAFSEKNPDIAVRTVYVPWSDYFNKLRTDVGGGTADDLFLMNGSYIEPYVANGNLIEIGPEFDTLRGDWVEAAVEQYTLQDKLWGVPQLTDGGIALYYNQELLGRANVTAADLQELRWSPDGNGDTLAAMAKQLTWDAAGRRGDEEQFDGGNPGTWGYSAAQDLQGIYYNFIGSNGGQFQNEQNQFVFASPESTQAFEYLARMINVDKTSPAASNTNSNGDFTRDQFLQGKIALFQSGVYNLKNVADGADFPWGIAPMPSGPEGAVSVVNTIIVAGNGASPHRDAVVKVLQWLGSPEGAGFIGAEGAGLPAVTSAQQGFQEYWQSKDIDPSQFARQGEGRTMRAPAGSNYSSAFNAWKPVFDEIFLGRTPAAEGLPAAQDAANRAMAG